MNRCPDLVVCLKRDLQCLRPEASLVLIYRPNVAGMKRRVDLAQPVNRTPDLWCGSTIHYHSTLFDQNNYYEPVDEARELALQRTIDYHIKNKIRYDARCMEKKFNKGDLVVYEEFQYPIPNTRKLSTPFYGYYEIIKQCSEVTYEINKPNSLAKKDSQIVHTPKLRCFYSPDNVKLSHE
ncbi:transposon Tf2-11 polyprotein [Trichonephila clavipes]|nr:transposon Tf2-11 polyprotein [Trichonephila clavipes]